MKPQVYQRRPGVWSVVIEVGKQPREQKWITVRGTKREAQAKWVELTQQVQTGRFVRDTKKTVEGWLSEWLEKWVRVSVRPSTFQSYTDAVKFWGRLGSVALADLDAVTIQGLVAQAIEEGYAPATIRQRLAVLRAALNRAVMCGMLYRDPSRGVTISTERREVRALDVAGLGRVLKAAENTPWHLPILIAATTGMRRGEVLALRWQDVDLEGGSFRVTHSYGADGMGPAKTRGSNRPLPLPPITVEAMRQEHKRQAEKKLRYGGGYADLGLVCADERGNHLKPASLTIRFGEIARSVGADITFHGLRATHATMLLGAGINTKVVQERLGHSRASQTLDRYSAVLPSMQAEAVAVTERELRTALA